MITSAIGLGLLVVSMAITTAFGQQRLVALDFVAAPYRQDDYSADNVDTPRLNPLDEGLVKEIVLEDPANSIFLADTGNAPTVPASIPTNISVSIPAAVPTNTPAPIANPTNGNKPPSNPTKPPNPNKPPPNPNKTPNPHKP